MGAPYQQAFEAILPDLPGNRTYRKRAMEKLAFPDRRNEAWRFTSVPKLLADEYAPSRGGMQLDGAKPLLATDSDALSKLGRALEPVGFVGLNAAFFPQGALVHVDEGEAHAPVRIAFSGHAGLTTPRVLVVAEARSSVEILIENTLGEGLHVPVIEVFAGTASRVGITHVVRGEAGRAVSTLATRIGRKAEVAVRSFVLGGEMVRVELHSHGAEQATIDASGLVLARDRQHVDHHLELHHDASDMVSRQLFRNILDDRARAVFTGAVTVGKDITGSDAGQAVNTLLLSDGASAVTRPWLEIHNDDVVASHGATVGRLDAEALFYLRQRGLDPAEAQRLLTAAFASEVVSMVPESFRTDLQARVDRWLA